MLRGLELGELRLGTGPYRAELSVGKVVARLAASHPGLRIDVTHGDPRAMVDSLLAGRLDLAVVDVSVAEGDDRVMAEPLPVHPACFYCRAAHPLLAEADPSPERTSSSLTSGSASRRASRATSSRWPRPAASTLTPATMCRG